MSDKVRKAVEIEQFEYYEAVFKPKRLDTLKPASTQFIGETALFYAGWIIESGVYEGQWAMQTPYEWSERQRDVPDFDVFVWIPEEDLEIIRHVPREELYGRQKKSG